MPTQHPPELVEKVMRALESAWTDSDDPDHGWAFMARYALDLAERAADEAVTAYRLNDAPGGEAVLTRAVRRAVGGA